MLLNFSEVHEYRLDEEFGNIVQKQWFLLCKIAYCVTHDYDATPDIVGEAIVKVCRVLKREAIGAIEPYLHTAVRRAALDYVERLKNEVSYELLIDLGKDTEFRKPDQMIVLLEEIEAVQRAMDRLPPRMARVIQLRFQADWSLEEIAQELGYSINTIKSDLYRGRERLKKILQTA
jgi:RNA polymerase sigma factor (sigma-70 family)